MLRSSVIVRPIFFSKLGDFFSGGFTRTVEPPHVSTRGFDAPKVKDTSPGTSRVEQKGFDQSHVNSKVEAFDAPGHSSGARQPGDTPDAEAPSSPELASYKAEQQKKWQAQKDAEMRDKIFGQPVSGRVDGKEVEPFSSKSLSDEAESLSSSAKTKLEKAAPARASSLLRTSLIALPFSALGLVVAGTANAFIKPLIETAPAPGLTKQDIKDTQIVEQSTKDVFVAANAFNDLKGDAHVAPNLSWALKSNDERMDVLEEMLDITEAGLASEAQTRGIPFTLGSSGVPKDDIESRALAINSRLAVVTALLRSIRSTPEANPT